MAVREKFDPNGPFAPRATTSALDPNKCVAAQLGAVGNERQCTLDRVDGEWCEKHGPTFRAKARLENQITDFQAALNTWVAEDEAITQHDNLREAAADRLNTLFAAVVTEQQLLAKLPWQIDAIKSHYASISCSIKDSQVEEFLEKMRWEKISWHHTLKIGDLFISCDDGWMNISFDSPSRLLDFCKAQGIKPDLKIVERQRKEAQLESEKIAEFLKGFGNE